MVHWTHKDMGIKLDNESATLTDISAHVNSQELARTVGMGDDTGMGEEEATFLPLLGGNTFPLNGILDSTMSAILEPLIGDNTSLAKTIQFQSKSDVFYYGDGFFDGINITGAADTLQTWSGNFVISGALTKTSVTQS